MGLEPFFPSFISILGARPNARAFIDFRTLKSTIWQGWKNYLEVVIYGSIKALTIMDLQIFNTNGTFPTLLM